MIGAFSVDLMTLMRLCALTALLFGVGMLLAAAGIRRYRDVLAHIGVSNLLFVVALALVAERGGMSAVLGAILPTTLCVAGIILWHRGTAILLDLKQMVRMSVLVMAAMALAMLATDFPDGDPLTGAVAFYGVIAWLMLHHAWQIYVALRPSIGRILRLTIVAPKLMFAAFALARLVALFVLPTAGGMLFVDQGSILNTILFLVVFVNLVGLNVGFALLTGFNLIHRTELLHYQARHDLLTDVFNRRALMDVLEREIARRRRGAPEFSVLMIDLDHFKRFNDLHGHLVGDAALIHVADQLRKAARTQDVLARFGGEEFCVLLPATGVEEARRAAERLRAAVAAAPLRHRGGILEPINISVGVATHQSPLESWDSLLGRADAALYEAKSSGRNTIRAARSLAAAAAPATPAGSGAAAR